MPIKTIKTAKKEKDLAAKSDTSVRAGKDRYIEAVGRRKSAIARVRIYPSTNKALKSVSEDKGDASADVFNVSSLDITVNDRTIHKYFCLNRDCQTVAAPFIVLNATFRTTIKIVGGGTSSQAEAARLGLARALNALNEKWRRPLRAAGYLTRDSRKVERKKPGLRKARRPQQWRKR